jgi:hypothetical protein
MNKIIAKIIYFPYKFLKEVIKEIKKEHKKNK